MNGEAIMLVSGAVVALTQLVKWAGLPDRRGPWAVLALAAVGVFIWTMSQPEPFVRTQIFSYFAGWVAVAMAAAGIFGFTRAAPEAVSSMKAPPAGAGSNPTT